MEWAAGYMRLEFWKEMRVGNGHLGDFDSKEPRAAV